MFGFEKLVVYQKSEDFYSQLSPIFSNSKVCKNLKDQLRRSSSSVVLNIAEGSGKHSPRDKSRFYHIARGSISESIATIRLLRIDGVVKEEQFEKLYDTGVQIGKMLTSLADRPC